MEKEFSQIASLIGDPVRAKVLWALMDGRAYTATELSMFADTTPQNISMHLNKLVNAGLLSVEIQGRHRYYNYANPEVSAAIEAIASLAHKPEQTRDINFADKPVRHCRTCYDHLAGKVGVLLADAMQKRNFIINENNNFTVSDAGKHWFNSLGIDIEVLKKQKRAFARPCLDWSERRHHLAGSLGAALLNLMITNNWIRHTKNSRAMIVTGKGEQALFDNFKIDVRQT